MSSAPGRARSPASPSRLPLGKLPPDLLASLLSRCPVPDPRVLLGPGVGLDCAVLDLGERYLVVKSDPITFASDQIGWYAVQVNANDLATTGARPRWLTVTLLLPEAASTPALAAEIFDQVCAACSAISVSLVGGHTEITRGLDRPILSATLFGEVEPSRLVTPRGAAPGDVLLLTKGVPIEATAILARELPGRLQAAFAPAEIAAAAGFLFNPGISVLPEAAAALRAGGVSAMHDPTEGGLVGALWELSQACGHALQVDLSAAPVPALSRRICVALGVDPLRAIASGALLIAARPGSADRICREIVAAGIPCAPIGEVAGGQPGVWQRAPEGLSLLPPPPRDEIARLFDRFAP